jgi:hypothetical protein
MGHGIDAHIGAVKHMNDEHAAPPFQVLNDE